jgi:phosphatidylserine decarboxylase
MKKSLFILLQKILPQHLLSRLGGKLADWQPPAWFLLPVLRWFVRRYQVDMSLAAQPELTAYQSFNQFFIRRLKADVRPIATGLVSPADGTISELGDIHTQSILQAKNIDYSLAQLLAGETALQDTFANGKFATIYLSPRDYHRVHMPYSGKLLQSIYVPGDLFSVNPTTVNNVQGVFARNERLINIFETDQGPMAVILVGAMLVAGMVTTWQGKVVPNRFDQVQHWNYQEQNIHLAKGDELGYFNFGSTVILLFPQDIMQWQNALQAGTSLQMGQHIGKHS